MATHESRMDSHRKMIEREDDIGTVNAAQGVVFERVIASIREKGEKAPETIALKEELHKYTEILRGVQFGDPEAIRKARTSVREFVEKNTDRSYLDEAIYGKKKPDEFRPG